MKPELTSIQAGVLDFMRQFLAAEDRMPTMAEIAERFGWYSANAANEHVLRLGQKGWLEKRGIHWRFPRSEPLPPADQERELRIQAEGLLLQAEMLAWERTGDFGARGAADAHRLRMGGLIAGRSEAIRERMARDRGLPHA